MRFEILDEISDIETFATGSRIRDIARLQATSLKAKPWQRQRQNGSLYASTMKATQRRSKGGRSTWHSAIQLPRNSVCSGLSMNPARIIFIQKHPFARSRSHKA